MAKEAQELFDLLRGMNKAEATVLPGIVQDVNDDDTIDVEVDGLVYYEVRLKASVASGLKGIKPKPAVGSVVVMERLGDERSAEYQVVLYSELTEYSIEIANAKLLMDAGGFQLKKGNDTLAKVFDDLIAEILTIYAPMNKPAITQIKLRAAQLLK